MSKKHKLLLIALLGLWQGIGIAQPEMNDNSVVLYSMGYELGREMKGQSVEFRKEFLLQGINDALAGNAPLIEPGIQRQALASLKHQRSMENLKKGEDFLAENGKKAGVTTLPSGLQYRILSAGDGKIPGPEDKVTVAIRGSLIDGTEFISSEQRGEPVTLKVNKIIKGLGEALQLMPTGSKWRIYIPAQLAYGKRSPGVVPANSTLIYELDLLAVNAPEQTPAGTPAQEGK